MDEQLETSAAATVEADQPAKPPYETPVAIPLSSLAAGQGDCFSGSSNDLCSDGGAPGFGCAEGAAIT